MPYTPTNWVDGSGGGTPITATQLNRMETGIASAGASTVTVDGTPVASLAIDSTAITAADVGADPAGTASNLTVTPASHNWLSWVYDPALTVGSTANTAGVLYLARVRVAASGTVASVAVHISTGGTTLTNSFVGLFNSAGTRLGVSADQATSFQSAGLKTVALTASASVAVGYYYIAILVGGGTPPAFTRGGNASAVNAGLAAPSWRFATFGTGQTAIPSSVDMSTTAASSLAYWGALA